jgi:spoIIIJ-associated protein
MTEQEFLENLLAHMGCTDATVTLEETDEAVNVTIAVPEEESGMFIGHRGETLQALKTVMALVFREKLGEKRLSIDVNGYKERRAVNIRQMAMEAAEEVKATGQPVSLPPYLNGEERKIVHETLRDQEVETKSDGIGRERRLTVYPKGFLPA